jgi:hypothetical protein
MYMYVCTYEYFGIILILIRCSKSDISYANIIKLDEEEDYYED